MTDLNVNHDDTNPPDPTVPERPAAGAAGPPGPARTGPAGDQPVGHGPERLTTLP
jgi:hypothetical protein